LPTVVALLSSTSTKVSWPTHIVTSFTDRQIGARSVGLNIIGKLGCPNQESVYLKFRKSGVYTSKLIHKYLKKQVRELRRFFRLVDYL
jgi:hypothetical protein